jgi:molecular chaperone GrpE
MTGKKKDQQESSVSGKDASTDDSLEESEKELDSDKSDSEKKKRMKTTGDSVEVKQIEGKEPEKLEYYSKEYLIEKVSKLENELNTNQDNLKKLKGDAESWKNKYMRLQAEFENAQKRWDKNRQNLRLEYTASILKSFLPLYDSFKKALSHDKENMKTLKGFYDQFMNILKGYKAEPMEVKVNDPYDYFSQEALTSIEKADVPSNTILEVIQDGWKLDKEVLRYTKVVISKEPKPPEPEPMPETETDSEVEAEVTSVNESETETVKLENDSEETEDPFRKKDGEDSETGSME